MRKRVSGLIGAIFTLALAKGALLWLATKNIYPEKWIAAMIGYAESALASEAIWWMLFGLIGLSGLFLGPLLVSVGQRLFQKRTFHIELDSDISTLGDYERICAITVKNVEPNDLEERCLVQIESISGHKPDSLPMPLVLRTEGQINQSRSGRFTLSSQQSKTVPVLFRNPKRKNEWFFFDENGKSYFVPARDLRLMAGVYGGRTNADVQIEVKVKSDWDIAATIDAKKTDKFRFAPEPSKEEALLLLTQLRAKGVKIRNAAYSINSTSGLDSWSNDVIEWMNEVIETFKPMSAHDAEWIATLDTVPPPRVPLPRVQLGDFDGTVLENTFRQHDCRLARLDKLLVKHGVGATTT